MEGEELTWTGALQFLHPLAALATLTRSVAGGVAVGRAESPSNERFRAVSKDRHREEVSGDPGRLSAMCNEVCIVRAVTCRCRGIQEVKVSRRIRCPDVSSRLNVPFELGKPAA